MRDTGTSAPLTGGVALLERAVSYAVGSLRLVTPDVFRHRTPCREWDLRDLLGHLDDSMAALTEAVDRRHVTVGSSPYPPGEGELVAGLRDRARDVVASWTCTGEHDTVVSVAGSPLTASVVSAAGALELAVHGWDVAVACGVPRPIPRSLADELLDLAPVLIVEADRPHRFAAPLPVSPLAGPSDRLVAFLGRSPP